MLLVTSRFPLPPWRGNQVRTVQWLRALGGHRIAVVAPEPEDRSLEDEIRAEHGVEIFTYRAGGAGALLGAAGALVGGRPLQEGLFHLSSARSALDRALAAGPWDLAIVQMVRCYWAVETIRRHRPPLPILFDAIDAMGLHYGRAANEARGVLGALLHVEAARCRKLEAELAGEAVLSTAVAPRDLEALGVPEGRGRVVPVAAAGRPPTDLAAAGTVLLSGNLGYRPTVQGALWFAEEVWPRTRERHPEARWVLAGARPPASVRRLDRLPGVEVHGDVPDLAPYLAAARVAIAPMRSGSGVPMKVLEAWACGVPVIAHPWAAAGLLGEGGVRVARDAKEWVGALDGLLSAGEEAARLGRRGRELWERHYRRERVEASVRELVESTITIASPSAERRP